MAALLTTMTVLLVSTAAVSSATPDEIGAHVPSGYLYWTGGRITDGIDNLPLGQLLVAAPVAVSGIEWELFSDRHLLLFRLPVVALMVAAAWTLWRLVRQLAGGTPALASLALFATSPNLIAHGSLANLDGQMTAWFVFFAAASHAFVRRPDGVRLAVVALVFGAALATKAQAVLLPAVLVAAAVSVRRTAPLGRRWSLLAAVSLPAAALLVACASSLYVPFSGHGPLPPRFAENLLAQLTHSRGGHHAYLLGAYSLDGWWYYFPVVVLVKTPLATLGLLVAGLARRPSARELALLWTPPAVLLAAAMASGLNIGLRHILPAYPFLLAVAGIGAARLMAERRLAPVGLALLGLAAVAGLSTHPHHLSFFNRLAGGSGNGHRVLLDSNFDWAQADRFLARHVARSGLTYAICPDPYQPTTGPVLVNANARYGISTTGPAAYRWLDGHEPVAQIARVWFEYRIPGPAPPPDPVRARRETVERYVLDLRRRSSDLEDPTYRLLLAQVLAELGSYRAALEEIRAVLRRRPDWEPPLWLGSELVLGRAMGALRFEGDEYLTGFREVEPEPVPELREVASVVAATPRGRSVATLLTVVGMERVRAGDRAAGRRALTAALTLDPAARAAADALLRLEATRAAEQ